MNGERQRIIGPEFTYRGIALTQDDEYSDPMIKLKAECLRLQKLIRKSVQGIMDLPEQLNSGYYWTRFDMPAHVADIDKIHDHQAIGMRCSGLKSIVAFGSNETSKSRRWI